MADSDTVDAMAAAWSAIAKGALWDAAWDAARNTAMAQNAIAQATAAQNANTIFGNYLI